MKQCAREKWVVSTRLAAASVCMRKDKVGVRIRAKEMLKITLVRFEQLVAWRCYYSLGLGRKDVWGTV